MTTYKKGDRYKLTGGCAWIPDGTIVVIDSDSNSNPKYHIEGREERSTAYDWCQGHISNLVKISEKENNATMARRTFRLVKDSPGIKKGTLIQEACDDGDQEYVVLDPENSFMFDDWSKYFTNPRIKFTRDTVEKQPQWFQEVFKPEGLEWLTADELQQWNDFKNNKKVRKEAPTEVTDTLPASKYAWAYKMKKGEVRYFNTDEMNRTVASVYAHAKRFDKKFKFTKLDNITSKVKRVL